MTEVNAQYNVAAADSLSVRVAAYARRKMYRSFIEQCTPSESDTILDIGATSDQTYEASNYLEAWYPHKHRVTAAGVDDATFLTEKYPGMQFVPADARELPFPSNSFDFVHSSAVLEHVGSRNQQELMIREAFRVARKAVFLTTPNRWFPIEFHTVLPLVHWLPPTMFRSILRGMGHTELSREENLNLLGANDIKQLCIRALPADANWEIDRTRLAGFPSNLLLIVFKTI